MIYHSSPQISKGKDGPQITRITQISKGESGMQIKRINADLEKDNFSST